MGEAVTPRDTGDYNCMFHDDALFSLARAAKLGQLELPHPFGHLRDWIQVTYDVRVVYIEFELIKNGPWTTRPRLTIILETDDDYASWHEDTRAIKLDIEHNILTEFKKLARDERDKLERDDVFLVLESFADECLNRACSAFLEFKAQEVTQRFSALPIWRIAGAGRYLVVFFETDAAVRRSRDNGNCDMISRCCFDGVKQYDEFGYLTDTSLSITYDSKETVDKKYEGNLYYYFK